MSEETLVPAEEISRWECPQCYQRWMDLHDCPCGYSGGPVEVWYVRKDLYQQRRCKCGLPSYPCLYAPLEKS